MEFPTIAAVSTPPGKGGVALLRISGSEAFAVADRVFRPRGGRPLSSYPDRIQVYGDVLASDGKTVLDDGLLTRFSAPRSFTGENVVEITCHGGVQITAMILSAVLESGAVPAGPGEFSRRAFLSGKMTLTAAEGVADLLDAKTEEAALLSSKTSRGKLSERIDALSEQLQAVAATLWAYLDYPEEDLGSMTDGEMIASLTADRFTP